ncbi:MAG: hypothetical protein KC731_31380 [Myxococcales bacterium]|nr:hypothetical protein [Myxococcales bacterium]
MIKSPTGLRVPDEIQLMVAAIRVDDVDACEISDLWLRPQGTALATRRVTLSACDETEDLLEARVVDLAATVGWTAERLVDEDRGWETLRVRRGSLSFLFSEGTLDIEWTDLRPPPYSTWLELVGPVGALVTNPNVEPFPWQSLGVTCDLCGDCTYESGWPTDASPTPQQRAALGFTFDNQYESRFNEWTVLINYLGRMGVRWPYAWLERREAGGLADLERCGPIDSTGS